jgi:hypothetical protein
MEGLAAGVWGKVATFFTDTNKLFTVILGELLPNLQSTSKRA